MWVFTSTAALSIVQHFDHPDALLVRSRFKGHIEDAFPGINVVETPDADYRYRAVITRSQVALYLTTQALDITYTNFKSSVKESRYHRACMDVWAAFASAARRLAPAFV